MTSNTPRKLTWLTTTITFDPSYPNDGSQRFVEPQIYLASLGSKLPPLPPGAQVATPPLRARTTEYDPPIDVLLGTSSAENTSNANRQPTAVTILVELTPHDDRALMQEAMEEAAKEMAWAGAYTMKFSVEVK
ncbi:hypothetical protein NMY22_g17380 [Coprinellus aureogranulatus]|nr:hypothetical protein NMY22_g17380 [Coprinellus aureogranulatus]